MCFLLACDQRAGKRARRMRLSGSMEATVSPAPLSSTEHEVRRLRQLHEQGRHAEALDGARSRSLDDLPENRDLLLIAASSLRHLMRIDEALAMLERLERLQPRFSRLHQERGLCHVALKDAPRAIDALLRAVNINPALPMSWRMLEGVYRLTGDDRQRRHRRGACRHAEEPAAGSGDGDLALFRRRACAGRADHPRLPAAARRSSRGHAAAGQDRHGARRPRRCRAAAGGRAGAGARSPGARATTMPRPCSSGTSIAQAREQVEQLLALDPANPDYRVAGRHAPRWAWASMTRRSRSIATCWPTCRTIRTCICGSAMR